MSAARVTDRKGNRALSYQPVPSPGAPEQVSPDQASTAPPPPDPRLLLFTPGPRLGWVFRDRRELASPYPEPQPSPQAIQDRAAARSTAAEEKWQRAWRWAGKPSIALAILLVLLAGCSHVVSGSSFSPGLTIITIVVLCVPGLGYTGWCWFKRDQSREVPPEQEYSQAVAEWQQRAQQHASAELARLAAHPEWGSVSVPPRRTDVYGGTLAGWQALLAVHGSSLLAQRPLIIADLTGQYATAPLVSLAQGVGVASAAWRLPGDLGRSGLLAELSPEHLADAVAEALHAGAQGGARTERAIDARIIRQLAETLAGGGLTARRMTAAIRTALGHAGAGDPLTKAEEDLIKGPLFPPGTREQYAPSLVRLDAVFAKLAEHAGEGWPAGPAQLTCLSLDAGARSAASEVLAALVVQWLTVQLTAQSGAAPAVIVVGADEITRAHTERLADACELRAVPLTLLFRHLRDETAVLLGGGTTAFMRLGNHHEAEQAATYLGRQHTFVMSSFTATRGGNATSSSGGSDGYGTSDTSSNAKTRGWQNSGFLGFGGDSSGGKSRTTGTAESRNWSGNWSQADGTNWADASARQRVYEYRVEPSALQNLPDFAVLLADRTTGALRLRAVECDPEIITLPGASTAPLGQAGQLAPHAGAPQTGAPQSAAPPAIAPAGATWPRQNQPSDQWWLTPDQRSLSQKRPPHPGKRPPRPGKESPSRLMLVAPCAGEATVRSATLITWAMTAGVGSYMLRTWIVRGGLRRERARAGGLPPQLLFGHATLALTGLVLWGSFVLSGERALGWAGIGCLMVAVGMGVSTVTLWTPYPAAKPGERRVQGEKPRAPGEKPADRAPGPVGDPFEVTDDMIARLLDDPRPERREHAIRPNMAVLVPVIHGFLAMATFVLAVTAASMPLAADDRELSLADARLCYRYCLDGRPKRTRRRT